MLAKKFKDLNVGDDVFLVENDSRHCSPRYVKVAKVGRKYVHLQTSLHFVQKVQEWEVNGYAIAHSQDFPHCSIFATKEDYEAMQLWHKVTLEIGAIGRSDKIDRVIRDKIVELLKEPLNL
jgi:hypothetical protein